MGDLHGIRVGVVGTGWMAETHTEALRRLGIEVAGVAGRTPERAREVADRLGLATAYDSVEALVADDSLAAVHVTSPNDVHAAQAAAVIGGTSILGGVGGYTGTILGALILTVLNRLLLSLDTTEAFRQILYGLIVLALAWVYVRLTGQRGAS